LSLLAKGPMKASDIEDNFNGESQWTESSGADGNVIYGDGALALALSGKKAEISSLSKISLPDTFYLELTLESALCGKSDIFGIIFWRFSELGTYRALYRCEQAATFNVTGLRITQP